MNAVTLPRSTPGSGAGAGAGEQHPDLWVVEPGRRRNTLWFALLIAAICGAAIFVTVTMNALGAADAIPIAELEQRLAEAERRHDALRAELATLEDPSRVERIARDDLGLVATPPVRVLDLESEPPSRRTRALARGRSASAAPDGETSAAGPVSDPAGAR